MATRSDIESALEEGMAERLKKGRTIKRILMNAKGLNQSKVADLLGLSPAAVSAQLNSGEGLDDLRVLAYAAAIAVPAHILDMDEFEALHWIEANSPTLLQIP